MGSRDSEPNLVPAPILTLCSRSKKGAIKPNDPVTGRLLPRELELLQPFCSLGIEAMRWKQGQGKGPLSPSVSVMGYRSLPASPEFA